MPSRRRLRAAIGVYLALCFVAQLWPVASLANRITPRVVGLPFLMAWYVGGVFAVFLGLCALYATEHRGKGVER